MASVRRSVICCCFVAVAFFVLCPASIAGDLVVGVRSASVDRLVLEVGGATDSYFQVLSATSVRTSRWPVVNMRLGQSGVIDWDLDVTDLTGAYFRVKQAPLSSTNDYDADQLDDPSELLRGSDPLRPDTDGDGMQDGPEVASGFDPLRSNDAAVVEIRFPIDGGRLP